MTVFDKFRNCITEPRCLDCEGIPSVCEEDHQSVTIPKALALDVLNELKEQEAVKPQLSMSGMWYECPICRRHLTKNMDNYCARCGRPVKWK